MGSIRSCFLLINLERLGGVDANISIIIWKTQIQNITKRGFYANKYSEVVLLSIKTLHKKMIILEH